MPDSLRILLVDDDALDRRVTVRALLSSDLVVDIVETSRGAEALERLAREPFDGVLLDFQLPDADGLEILREVQARGILTPIIILTGHGNELIAVELMKAGACDYLAKSKLTPEALARSLSNAVRLRRMESHAAQAEVERGRLMENLTAEQGQMEAILHSMTEGLIVGDLAGNVVTMNPAALLLYGYSDVDEVRQSLDEFSKSIGLFYPDGQPVPLEEWPLARALRGETFANLELTVYLHHHDRSWPGSYSGAPVRNQAGNIILVIVTVRDITDIKAAQQRAAFLAAASAILASSLEARTTVENVVRLTVPRLTDWCEIQVLEPSGMISPWVIAHTNPGEEARAWEMQQAYPLGLDADTGTASVLQTVEPLLFPEVSETVLRSWARNGEHLHLLRSFGVRSYLCVPLLARGRVLGLLSFASTQSGRIYGQNDLALAQELGRRVSAALDNAGLFEETRMRAERESLINKIGQALRVTLDMEEILQIVTEEVGQALKVSRCSWARLNPLRDTLEVAPQQYTAPGAPPLTFLYRLADCPPEVVEKWTSGQPVVSHDYTQDQTSLDAGVKDLTRAYITCPVFLRGQFGGLFIVHQNGGPRRWTPDEVMLLSAVADILALALENARLYTREHRVADMLQTAFLTDIPDTLPGLALASNYRAGLEEARVGGDYYDAFSLPDGRVALVIADVSGKGLNAAVQTATVKYSLRAFATEAAAPSLVLTRLNRMLRSDSSGLADHFVTLFYAVFDPDGGRLTWASAGHETMIIKRFDGGITLLEANSPILGIVDHLYEQVIDRLGVEDSLILYTDGLTEARDADTRKMLEMEGVLRLVKTAPAEAGPGALASRLQQAALEWTGGRPQDDMALLVVRRVQTSEPSEKNGAEEEGLEEGSEERLFDLRFSSRADYAAEVRQAVAHWMPILGFNRETTEDFQTAVTEAVTNAVRHGSPAGDADELRVTGQRTAEGALRVEVTDSGPGLPLSKRHPAMPEPEALSGRGLPLMQEYADAVEFHRAANGHCVVLLKHRRDHSLK